MKHKGNLNNKIKSYTLDDMIKVYPIVSMEQIASHKGNTTIIQPNQKYNHVTTIYCSYKIRKDNNLKQIGWVCKCDCGRYTFYQSDRLLSGEATTCGPECIFKKRNTHNLIGKTFGRLTVIEREGKSSDGHASWRCKCSCGNESVVSGRYLESGGSTTCGHCPDNFQSLGNNYINSWLTKHNVNFKAEVRFIDCRDKYPLIFDFIIYDNSNKILKCIEYQGTPHYTATGGWITEESVEALQKRDKIKKDYCDKMNIPLLCIPYTDYNNLDEILKKFIFN